MKVTEQVAQFAEPVVQSHGCTLWDVEYVREGGEWFLRDVYKRQISASAVCVSAISVEE